MNTNLNSPQTTKDTLLNGQVSLYQPKEGYRISVDSVFLASAIQMEKGKAVLDMGCGVGAITFCLLHRLPELKITGVDIQQNLLDLAQENATLNDMSPALTHGDISDHTKFDTFDQIVTNPPYLETGAHMPSPNPSKSIANAGQDNVTLDRWLKSATLMLKHGGYLTLVQRADRLDDIITSLASYKMGSFVIYPLWSKAGRPANRIIISARKGKFAPCKTLPGLVIHQETGDYTKEAQEILNGTATIDLYAH